MERRVVEMGDVTVIRSMGMIRSYEFITDREELRGWLDEGRRKFVFNVSGLSHIGSSSLGVLLQCHKLVAAEGAVLKIVVSAGQMELLELTRLDDVFDAHTDEHQALATFPVPPSPSGPSETGNTPTL